MTSTLTPLLLLLLPLLPHLLLLPSPSLAAAASDCTLHATFDLTLQISLTPSIDPSIDDDTSQVPILAALLHTPSTTIFRVSQRLNDTIAELISRGTSHTFETWLSEDGYPSTSISDHVILESLPFSNTTLPTDGSVTLSLRARHTATRLSILVHLSPSPAWFAGLDAFDLCALNESDKRLIVLKNLDGGLDKARAFNADPDPYPQGETVPVSLIDSLQNRPIVIVSIERMPQEGGAGWWIPMVGALVGVAVVLGLGVVVFRRWRARAKAGDADNLSQMSKPLTGESDRVEW